MARGQQSGSPRAPVWLVGVIGTVLVAVIGVAAAAGNPVATSPFVRRTRPVGPGEPTEPPITEVGRGLGDEAGWLGYVVAGLVILAGVVLVVTVVVLAIRMLAGRENGLLRRRVLEPEEVDMLLTTLPDVDLLGVGAPVTDAVHQGLIDMVSGKDVRSAIIAAWLRLEDAAAVAGTPRRDTDAPGDLVHRLLLAHAVRPAKLEELAELYRRARFSRTPLDERDRAAAVHALSAVRGDLLGEPVDANAGPAAERWPTRWT